MEDAQTRINNLCIKLDAALGRYFAQCGFYSKCSTIGAMRCHCFDHVCNRENFGFKQYLIALQTTWIA